MNRLTEYDVVRRCYRILPDVAQGQHIQRLGMYEDRDTPKQSVCSTDPIQYKCNACGKVLPTQVECIEWNFCPECGQRLKITNQEKDDDE